MSLLTPENLHSNKKLGLHPNDTGVNLAFICYCPFPEAFLKYTTKSTQSSSDRFFIHTHPQHVAFGTTNNGTKFVVISEVYGGPVSATTVEELHYYGVKEIVGIGFLGALKNIKVGTICYVDSCPVVDSVTKCYQIKKTIRPTSRRNEQAQFLRVGCWTTDCMYQETLEKITYARSMGCDVVNMDTSHLYAISQKFDIECSYFAVVSDIVGEKHDILDAAQFQTKLVEYLIDQ